MAVIWNVQFKLIMKDNGFLLSQKVNEFDYWIYNFIKISKSHHLLNIHLSESCKSLDNSQCIEFSSIGFEKNLFGDFCFQKCFRDFCISWKRLILTFFYKKIKECMKMIEFWHFGIFPSISDMSLYLEKSYFCQKFIFF